MKSVKGGTVPIYQVTGIRRLYEHEQTRLGKRLNTNATFLNTSECGGIESYLTSSLT